jgi:hypothetical protein
VRLDDPGDVGAERDQRVPGGKGLVRLKTVPVSTAGVQPLGVGEPGQSPS